MKIVRKPPAPVAPVEPQERPNKQPAPESPGMRRAIEALAAAAERIQAPVVHVEAPPAPKVDVHVPAAEKAKTFTVRVTKRDAQGRVLEFDIAVNTNAADAADRTH